jgi:hypothetical protein
MEFLKQLLRQNFVVDSYLGRKRIINWIGDGTPIPPPHDIKRLAILYYGAANGIDTLVETGTYLGDMVWAQKDFFRKIYSIELSSDLYERAKLRFRGAHNVELLHGDSSQKLAEVIRKLEAPALFWLDGHYSGGITAKGDKECPIFEELTHIFASGMAHVILIDDARTFIGANDYPTIPELSEFIHAQSNYTIRIQNDIIALLPNES